MMHIDREVNVMAQLLRETPKANYPIQLLKGALLAMSEKTNGVSEAHLIVARVAKETEDGLLLATRDLLSACEASATRTGLSERQQKSGLNKIKDALKMMYRRT